MDRLAASQQIHPGTRAESNKKERRTRAMNIRLDDYRYIIIVDKDYHTHVYNQGVFLEGLQEVSFNAEVDALPELIIKKV